ncbi:hypothetical protein GCM10008957_30970 [Deinococcus ruber]|uniref:Helicase C-terminal domain-containing protein n=1 Tax=Deinococcus ruber TaxID=1848197 RepID=A0A918CCN1_9DEIO|nr:hypothetical protein GCM10008957_30970 [Deinococcus ruber]
MSLLPILPLTGAKTKPKKAPAKTPPVAVVDPALVAFAMRSHTQPAPEPSAWPMGVEALPRVTDAERVKANELARQIVSGEGELTPAAYAALRAWSGEGGLGGSTSVFYTPRSLVDFMWSLCQALLPAERALEFSCGSGAFIARAPALTRVTGVEIDETSAKIAQQLFPHAAIHHAPFEQYVLQSEDALFPLVIGNVPFGVRGASAREHLPALQDAHWYFTLTGLTRVLPGGLMAVVVPESMLRNPSEWALRELLVDRAEVLTASVIPEEAFRATGAGVTTVLLVLRRHDAGVMEALAALTQGERDTLREQRFEGDVALKLFVEGRSIFHQDAQEVWQLQSIFRPMGVYAKDPVQTGRFGTPVYSTSLLVSDDHLGYLVSACKERWHGILTRPGLEAAVLTTLGAAAGERVCAVRPALHPIREGTLSACQTYRFRSGAWWYDTALGHPATLSALRVAQAVTQARRAAQRRDREQQVAQTNAWTLHDTHLATFGPYDLATLGRAARTLPVLNVLVQSGGDLTALFGDLTPPTLTLAPGTIQDIAQQLEAYGLLDETALLHHSGASSASVSAHLLAEYAFTGRVWEASSTYYSGQASHKAQMAEQLAESHQGLRRQALLTQAEQLRARAPWRDVMDMTLEARDALIPLPTLQAWVNEYLGSTMTIHRNRWDKEGELVPLVLVSRSEYRVALRLRNDLKDSSNLHIRQQVDAGRIRALESYLNYQTPVAPVVNQELKPEAQINAERSAHQQQAMRWEKDLAAHFRSFVLESDHSPAVEAALNEGRYALLPSVPDHRPLVLPAYQGPLAHPFQAAHVRRAARMDGVILNFGVGLGKTLAGLMLAALLRQTGRCRLPALLVPLSRLGDWVMNAATAVPGLRLRVIGGEVLTGPTGEVLLNADGEPTVREDSGAQRRAKVASLMSDPPDLVLFSLEAFGAIPMLEETRKRMIESEPSLMSDAATSTSFDDRARKLGGHRAAVAYERTLQRNLSRGKIATETELPFEVLGIDAVIGDESHLLKNVFSSPRVYGESNPKFLGSGGESDRALDAHQKFRFIRQHGGCVALLTATWFSNSPLEIFNMLSLVTDALPSYGITDVEAFTARFCIIEPRLITLPDGDVEFKACVVGFKNRDELSGIIGQHVIRETEETCLMHDGVGMPLPPLVEVEHLFDLAEPVQDAYDAQQALVPSADSEGENHLFAIFSRMMKLTLHPPLMGLHAPNARFATCVQACVEARAHGGRNVVFMYLGGEDGETYQALKRMLVAAGYPAREIEIITATTHPVSGERLTVERRLRRGELTCVIGSQIIEQGGNFQGCTDLHHLDYPHHFEAFRQRIGRARRQGTTVSEIRNHVYFARGSFDVLRYQTMLGKKGWADQVYDPSLAAVEHEGLGFDGEEIAVMLSRNPAATRALILAKKEARAADRRAATLLLDLEVIRQYLDTVRLLNLRWHAAWARKNGPSVQDEKGFTRLITSLRGLHAQVGALRAAGHPLVAVTRLKSAPVWLHGLPLHPGMTFAVGAERFEVVSAQSSNPLIQVEGVPSGTRSAIRAEALEQVTQVLPSADAAHFGDEAFEQLPTRLRDRIEAPEAALATEAISELVTAPPMPVNALTSPLRLRYGLSVTDSVPVRGAAAVFSIQGDTLLPGAVPGATLVLIEYRAERDVRKVTLIIEDPQRRQQMRTLLHTQDPRLRGRVDALLQHAI